MAFQEVFVTQFTSPTTCYTGCRHDGGYLATETHSLQCSTNNGSDAVLTSGSLPQQDIDGICVGHDQNGAWELFCFLSTTSSDNNAPRHHARSESMASMSSLPETSPEMSTRETPDAAAIAPPVAWMALQSRQALAPTYTASLAYRPLTPLLMTLSDSSNCEDEEKVIIWVGSADDAKLQCYIANRHDHTLCLVDLSEPVFEFASPIMAMDSLRQKKKCTLVVGCQDGTIRIISFECLRADGDDLSLVHIAAHTILVDGPIMSLHVSQQGDTTQLVIGSMCGFVCRLEKQGNNSWEGPWMVAEELDNKTEDAVLSVHMLANDTVAVGTHSGRCLVWKQREDGASYSLLWDCQLPYSIHGLSHTVTNNNKTLLLVTTRQTFHVFQQQSQKYCADTARRRVQELLSKRKPIMQS